MVKLSEVMNSTALNGSLKQVRNLEIEIDMAILNVDFAASFDNCSFVVCNGKDNFGLSIYTDQGLRFENCVIAANICVWGKAGAAGFEVLDKKGPNVFFDKCKWLKFSVLNPMGINTEWNPQLQISGYVNHFRSTPNDESDRFQLTISQCRFDKIEIFGAYSMLQIVEYAGNELIMKQVKPDYFWVRERMTSFIKYVDIDQESVKNIASSPAMKRVSDTHNIDTLKNLMDVFTTKKEGHSFLVINELYCSVAPAKTLSGQIALKFFKNFYSLKSALYMGLVILILFTFIFYFLNDNLNISFLYSLYAISGNPIFDANGKFYSALQAFEAFLGLFFVIFLSWVLGRKYSNYI